jgi:hypothetical protein
MNLSPDWRERVETAKEQRLQQIGLDARYLRYDDELANLNEGIKASGAYAQARRAYDVFTHDVLAEIPWVGSKLFPFRSPQEQYRKEIIEGAQYADWNRPWQAIIRPMIYDVASEDPFTAALKGATLGALVSGPMRWFSPLTGITSKAGVLPNPATALGGAVIGAGISSTRIVMGEDQQFIPPHVERRGAAVQYLDRLAYLKARSLQAMAIDQGQLSLASDYASMSRKTMVGATNPIMLRSALPTSQERRYFDYFMQLPKDERDAAIPGMTEYFAEAIQTAAGRDYPSVGETEARVGEYFKNRPIPAPNFLGWHPSVPIGAMKLKMVKHGLNGISDDYHRFGFYESQINELRFRLPDLYEQSVSYTSPPSYSSFKQLAHQQAEAIASSNAIGVTKLGYDEQFATAHGSRNRLTVNLDTQKDTHEYVRYYMRA